MGVIQTEELRTFEQRFGKTCPFCGRGWGNPERCDPEPGPLWKDTHRALCVRPEFPERPCTICLKSFQPRRHNTITCSDECRRVKDRLNNNERSRRRNKRRWEARRASA